MAGQSPHEMGIKWKNHRSIVDFFSKPCLRQLSHQNNLVGWVLEGVMYIYIQLGLLGILLIHSRSETYEPTTIMRWDRGILEGSV